MFYGAFVMHLSRPHLPLLILAVGFYLSGCSSLGTKTAQNEGTPATPPYKGGGYYKDDGPGANPPADLAAIPDAVPKREPMRQATGKVYKVLGRTYVPLPADTPYKERGLASWYGRKFHGKSTATGEPYDMYAMSAAHTTLPLPSYAKVTNLETGKSVTVRVNDRGPFHEGRIIDLSYTAAYKLDILKGVTPVEVEVVLPETASDSFTAQAQEEPVAPVPALEAVPPVLAAAEAEAETASVAPTKTSNSIYLQLGAFANLAKAGELLDRAKAILSRGFPGVMRLESNGLYKIQAGPFASNEEADQATLRVRDALGLKPFRVAGEPQAVTAQALPETPVALAPTTSPTPGLYLQVAAVSTPEAAQSLSQRITSRYGADLPGLTHVQAGSLVKVQLGPFASTGAAEQIALAYQQDFGTKPYRVTH